MTGKRGEVYVFGTGAYCTAATIAGLPVPFEKITKIFTLISRPRPEWLPDCLKHSEIVNVESDYSDQTSRVENYRRVASRVIGAAVSEESVAYCSIGSPVVFDRVTALIRDGCAKNNMPCTVFPTTSSVDAMLAYLGEDMAPGLQVSEARWAESTRLELDPHVATILFQVGAFWSDGLVREQDLQPSRLRGLQDYLMRHYPGFHFAVFVRAPFFVGDSDYLRVTRIDSIASGSADDLKNTSLFIPALFDPDRASKVWFRRVEREMGLKC